jgi:hypothetical protein
MPGSPIFVFSTEPPSLTVICWLIFDRGRCDGAIVGSIYQRFFNQYPADIGVDTASWAGPNRIQGIGLALGRGHVVIENRARALPITGTAKAEPRRDPHPARRTGRP